MGQKFILATLLLGVSIVCSSASAENSWQGRGSYDISWYSANKAVFEISTPKQLAGVAFLVNNGYTNFKSKSLKIVENIDLSERIWVPIGNSAFPFQGNFDGNNKTISGIHITKSSIPSPYINYGFFGCVKYANLSNLYLTGQLEFEIENYFSDQYLGGLCAHISNSEVKNCHSELPVSYDRDRADNATYTIYVGGMVGYSENNLFENCSFNASLKVGIGGLYDNVESNLSSFFKNSEFYLGGFCAYDYFSTFKYCSVEIRHFLMNTCGSSNSVMGKSAGSIVADSHYSSLHSCRAIINEVVMKDRGSKPASLSFNGLSDLPDNFQNNTKDGIYNCYSVIKKLEFVAGSINTSVYYGGISAQTFYDNATYKFKSNYSNSDFDINSYNLSRYNGYMGLTTFDTNSMKTSEFLDELNLYFTLNGEEPKWILEYNGYPTIKGSTTPTSISDVYIDTIPTKFSIFNLMGVRVKTDASVEDVKHLSPGIYIVNGRKILVK